MTFTKSILSTAAAIALSTSAAFATDVNSEYGSRDAGINAQEAGAAAELNPGANTDATITNSIEGENYDGRIDAKEAGQDVDLTSTGTTTVIDEDGRIDAKEAGQDAN